MENKTLPYPVLPIIALLLLNESFYLQDKISSISFKKFKENLWQLNCFTLFCFINYTFKSFLIPLKYTFELNY